MFKPHQTCRHQSAFPNVSLCALFFFSPVLSFSPILLFTFSSPFFLFLYSSFLFFPYSSFLIFTLFFFPLFLEDIPNPTIIRRQMATQAPLNSFFSGVFLGHFDGYFFLLKIGILGWVQHLNFPPDFGFFFELQK